jgi:hypothetical protein
MSVTLRDCFNNDSRGIGAQVDIRIPFESAAEVSVVESFEVIVSVKISIPWNSDRQIYFIYIPYNSEPTLVLHGVLQQYKTYMQMMGIVSFKYSDLYTSSVALGVEEIPPSDVLYVYTENLVLDKEALRNEQTENSIAAAITSMGITVHLREEEYRRQREKSLLLQAFISHDSRDKEAIAWPIASGLMRKLYKVWYDEFSLTIGDNLRESIERGIKDSNKCVLIITPNFLNNPGWTKKEFDSIFTRELLKQERVILPIWFNVSANDVYDYSPSLANTVALHWPDKTKIEKKEYDDAVQKIISAIVDQLGRSER